MDKELRQLAVNRNQRLSKEPRCLVEIFYSVFLCSMYCVLCLLPLPKNFRETLFFLSPVKVGRYALRGGDQVLTPARGQKARLPRGPDHIGDIVKKKCTKILASP